MKRRIVYITLILALISIFAMLFVVSAYADDKISVTYHWYSGELWETAVPNADGSFTLRANKKSGDGTVKLANGSAQAKEFYGWFDEEGNLYAPGETVTFDKSTRLYEAYGVTVYSAADLKAVLEPSKDSTYVKLGADMEINALYSEWDTMVINLNGKTLNVKSQDNGHSIEVKRGAFILHGEGTVIHEPVDPSKDDRGLVRLYAHGYADENNPQLFWIGKGVKINTPYHLLYDESIKAGYHMPDMVIAGEVNAKSLARINQNIETARCYVSKDAKLNLTTDFIQFKSQTDSVVYMYITLNGEINIANGQNSTLFNDFVLARTEIKVNGGKFCLPASDYEKMQYYLDDTVMLKDITIGELAYKEIVPSNCVHNWVKDNKQSVSAEIGTNGKDVFQCSRCLEFKTVITVYDASNSKIDIVVLDENGNRKTVSVRAGDVLSFDVMGVGEKSSFSIVGVKGSALYPAESILSIQISQGVSAVAVSQPNATLEEIIILDGVKVSLENLSGFTALKTIEIGVSDVSFKTGVKTVVETIKSEKAGATVSFDSKSFYKNAALKNLVLSAGSVYSFGNDSMRECGLLELVFPDNSTISWGGTAFAECQQLEYIYFGSNIGVKSVDNGKAVFDGISNLKKVIIMDLTYLGQWSFSNKAPGQQYGPLCDLEIYIHTPSIEIQYQAFNSRNVDYHVYMYTLNAPKMSAAEYSNCNITQYIGLPHKYIDDVITESTCVTQGTAGFKTDCPCGTDYRTSTYNTKSNFEASLNEISHNPLGTNVRYLPLSELHTESDILIDVMYVNGYGSLGRKAYKCLYCDEISKHEETPSFPVLIINEGYSADENDGGFVIGFKVDKKSIDEYESITGREVKYGLYVGTKLTVGKSSVFDENGKPIYGVLKAEFDDDYVNAIMKVVGLETEEKKNMMFTLGAYVEIVGAKETLLGCIEVGTPNEDEKHCFVSYNTIIGKT